MSEITIVLHAPLLFSIEKVKLMRYSTVMGIVGLSGGGVSCWSVVDNPDALWSMAHDLPGTDFDEALCFIVVRDLDEFYESVGVFGPSVVVRESEYHRVVYDTPHFFTSVDIPHGVHALIRFLDDQTRVLMVPYVLPSMITYMRSSYKCKVGYDYVPTQGRDYSIGSEEILKPVGSF